MTPYFGKGFLAFLMLFFERLCAGFPGGFASDEVQLVALFMIGASSALLGTFLVMRRMTMVANSLSHTILVGIVLAFLIIPTQALFQEELSLGFTGLLLGAFLTALLTVGLIHFFTHVIRLQTDASIGLVFTSLFAVGVLLVTLFTRNVHIGVEAVVGNLDALHRDDLKLLFWVTGLNVLCATAFYKRLKVVAFDPPFARSIGYSPALYDGLLMILVAGTAIAAFRAVGVLLFLAFLVIPVLTARFFTRSLLSLISFSIVFSLVVALLAVALSRHVLTVQHLPLSTPGLVVTLLGGFFALSFFRKKRVVA